MSIQRLSEIHMFPEVHRECRTKEFENSCFDCSVCLSFVCGILHRLGHTCQGKNGGSTKLFETCSFCEELMHHIRIVQLLRHEYERITEIENVRYFSHITKVHDIKIPAIYDLFEDHYCEPEPRKQVQFKPRILRTAFDCETCYKTFLAVFTTTGGKDGVLKGHSCVEYSCILCTHLLSFWGRYSSVARQCTTIMSDYARKFRVNLERYILLGFIRVPIEEWTATPATGLRDPPTFKVFSFTQIRQSIRMRRLQNALTSHIEVLESSIVEMNHFNVVVEGSIGAGKSLLLEYLKTLDDGNRFEFYQEPVSQWTNFEGTNLLDDFYKNPKENAFALQTFINLTKLRQFLEQSDKSVRIFERSLASSQECFMPILVSGGLVSKKESGILTAWSETLNASFPKALKIDCIIYLRTDPAKCYERIKKRNRPEEADVDIKYLEALHDIHETWIKSLCGRPGGPKVFQVDVTEDFERLKPKFQQIFQAIVPSS